MPAVGGAVIGTYIKLGEYEKAVISTLDARAQAVLPQIPNPGPHILAIRGYLRGAATINKRWAWTDAESKKYRASAGYQSANADVEALKLKFIAANPGYKLGTADLIRSLDTQINLWNGAATVQKAGDKLRVQALAEVQRAVYPVPPDPAATAKFAKFLKRSSVDPEPTVAKPL